MTNKNIVYLAISVIAAIIAGGIIMWQTKQIGQPLNFPLTANKIPPNAEQETPLDTSGWQTYRNEEYGFEVEHPTDWLALGVPGIGNFNLNIGNPNYQAVTNSMGALLYYSYRGIAIWWFQDLATYMLFMPNAVIASTLEENLAKSVSLSNIASYKQTSFAGQPAFEYVKNAKTGDEATEEDEASYGIVIKRGTSVYEIVVDGPNSYDGLLPIEKSILSTFKFIEPTPAVDTSAWKTYENQDYGYSLKYPKGCFFGPMPSYCKSYAPEQQPQECLCFLDADNPDGAFLQAYTGEKSKLVLAEFTVGELTAQFSPLTDTALIKWLKETYRFYAAIIPDKPYLQISGLTVVKVYYPKTLQAPSMEEIYFFKDGKFMHISMLDVDTASNRELYDQILSTFKFIPQQIR